jgi:hypothetical protein
VDCELKASLGYIAGQQDHKLKASLGYSEFWACMTLYLKKRKQCRRMNMVEILYIYIHVRKWKNENCWNYSVDGEIEKNDGESEFSYDML